MKSLEFYNPKNLAEVLKILDKEQDNATVIAGGTDLVLGLNNNEVEANVIINVKNLAELQFIEEEQTMIRIGANTPFTVIQHHPLIKKHAKLLSDACTTIGSPQIRNAGTPAGNIVTGSACADSVNALMNLDATLVVKNLQGERKVKLADFYIENSRNNFEGCYINIAGLASNEIITEIQFNKCQLNEYSSFRKIGRRKALAKSVLTVGMRIEFNDDDTVKHSAISLGAVGRYPYRVASAENVFTGKKLTPDVIEQCLEELSKVVVDNICTRASCAYKRESVKGAARDNIQSIIAQYKC